MKSFAWCDDKLPERVLLLCMSTYFHGDKCKDGYLRTFLDVGEEGD